VKDQSGLKGYRPIGILFQGLEKILKDQIASFCDERAFLYRYQSADGHG
jgi:hypothetical protein